MFLVILAIILLLLGNDRNIPQGDSFFYFSLLVDCFHTRICRTRRSCFVVSLVRRITFRKRLIATPKYAGRASLANLQRLAYRNILSLQSVSVRH
jgi:hypothetical protein